MLLRRILLTASGLCVSLWAQAPAADPGQKVVATVAGKDISVADVQLMLSKFNAQDVQTFQQNPQMVLSQYFLFLHLAEEADKAKLLDKSPYKEQYEAVRLRLLRDARINEENNGFSVTPQAMEAYYKEHSAQYEQAKIKVIYIGYSGQPAPAGADPAALEAAAKSALAAAHAKHTEAEARDLANDIVKQLRAGADFGKLVEQYSEDPTSKAAGGDFGVIKTVSEYPSDFKSAVFALKPGEISDPIRQPTAFYIIRLEQKTTQPLDEVREPIIQTIRNEHMNQWMKDLNASYQAVIKDSDYFKSVGTPPSPLLAAPPK
jgi:peptidyl-prolyl cis-trans isomerase C